MKYGTSMSGRPCISHPNRQQMDMVFAEPFADAWKAFPPDEPRLEMSNSFLTREDVALLIRHLQSWLDTGSLELK